MDAQRFDRLIRAWTSPRRTLLGGMAAIAGLGLGPGGVSPDVAGKRKRKKKKNKVKPNPYGCLSVGSTCQTADQCCSSICEGNKCRAHGTGICRQGVPGACAATSIEDLAALACNGTSCFCFRTTAGSNFCSAGPYTNGESCADCTKDADCEALGFPAGSACVPVSQGICGACPTGTACLAPCDVEPSTP